MGKTESHLYDIINLYPPEIPLDFISSDDHGYPILLAKSGCVHPEGYHPGPLPHPLYVPRLFPFGAHRDHHGPGKEYIGARLS